LFWVYFSGTAPKWIKAGVGLDPEFADFTSFLTTSIIAVLL
jgi:hypothetical protein